MLRPYLERDAETYCFSPRESELWRRAKQRLVRQTKVQPSQLDRTLPIPKRRPGAVYVRSHYTKAIRQTCQRHGIPHWHPNQLRHAAATKLRKQFGLEAAQVCLGHSRADVTQVYAERNSDLAAKAMSVMG